MTPFPELDELLADLVAEQQRVLRENFVAVYLQGSFAVGDADEWSDVDFLVAIERQLDDEERGELDRLHERLFTRDTHWAQHLEGSYAPREQLRAKSEDEWWYLDNGSTRLVLDTHCNLASIRWALREHGVTMAGPAPTELVDPVDAEELRAEARGTLNEYAAWAHEPQTRFRSGMSRWKQPYLVLTLCRALWTIEHATVVSKRRSAEWARDRLPEWRDLIDTALADRPNPWERVHAEAEPHLVARTIAFAEALVS